MRLFPLSFLGKRIFQLCAKNVSTCLKTQEEFDPSAGIDFVFSSFRKELIVGEIFVNVFNEQPTFAVEVSFVAWPVCLRIKS